MLRNYYFLLILVLAGCGANGSKAPVELPPAGKKVIFKSFGATFCVPCIEELPELNSALKSLSSAESSQVQAKLYVTDVSTESSAEAWASKLGWTFEVGPDYRCRDEYAKYWSGCTIPGNILLDANGNVLKNFGIGKLSGERLVSEIRKHLLQ